MSTWPIDLVDVAARVHERRLVLGSRLTFHATTASTNDDAKLGARTGAPHGSAWLADHQSHGRGRQGRAWTSAPGENVLLSLLVRRQVAPTRAPLAALVAGLAVRHAVAAALPDRAVRLKWPNDVEVHHEGARRKLAGILVEAQSRGAMAESIVLGIGVNVHTRMFPSELASRATSVAREGGTPDRAQLVLEVLTYLDEHLESVLTHGLGSLRLELERHDALLGSVVRSEAGSGTGSGIDASGRLLVRDAAGEIHAWSSGEVHLEGVPTGAST